MRITIEELKEIVKTSQTYKEVYKRTKSDRSKDLRREVLIEIEKNDISTSHLVVKLPKSQPKKIYTFEEMLVKDGPYKGSSVDIKRRLFKAGLLKNECYICGITDWRGNPITLQLDHINGRHTDNRLENLRILCPNCHAQTETFAGKNIKLGNRLSKICPRCNEPKYRSSEVCKKCKSKMSEVKAWPPDEELFKIVQEIGLKKTAKLFNAKVPSLQKRLKARKFDYSPYYNPKRRAPDPLPKPAKVT